MLNAAEKRFMFRNQCYEVLRMHYLMRQCSDSVADLDQSRVAAFERATQKLVGMCIPYKYGVDHDTTTNTIRIFSYDNDRTYMLFKEGEDPGDV